MKYTFLTTLLFLLVQNMYAQSKEAIGQEIKQLSQDWMIAAMHKDETTLNKIVAPEFTLGGTDLDQPVLSRDIWMMNTMQNLNIDSVQYLRLQVNVIDEVAIGQSTFYWSVSFRDMPAKQDTVDLIDTWIKRDQGWQVVSRLVVD